MEQKNAFIQIEIKDGDAILHYYPARDGGEQISPKEVDEYLEKHQIYGYDKNMLRIFLSGNAENVMNLGPSANPQISEWMFVKISLDKMRATCHFYPPSVGGPLMNIQDIFAQLQGKGIINGFDTEAVQSFLSNRLYNTRYDFAVGTPPVIGKDARIEYYFNTNPSLKPKHYEDGSVDYHELNTISGVMEGDLLARLFPADRGAPGRDILGREIPTRNVKDLKLNTGKNLRLSDDGTQMFSEVTGHVSLVDGQVFVSDVYEVPADVDNSTGNIYYNGNVHVRGSVRGGFAIQAQGDVIIDGVVEDAFVSAEGQVIVKCGIHGMNKGVIDAKGNVIIQFIENAKVFAGGYIETGSILYSEVNAGEDVLVNDKKGFITGGVIRAGGKVESRIIGSSMGAMTKIEVGMAPDKKELYAMLQKDILALSQKINKITPIVKTYQDFIQSGKMLDQKNLLYLNNLMSELKDAKGKLQDDRVRFNALHQELLNSKHAKIKVSRDIYPGVSITISDISMTTKDKRSFCCFEKKNGEIVVTNL